MAARIPPSKYEFPQKSTPITSGEHGIASLRHPDVGTLRFRSNPREFNWSYTLNKRVDQTYGGRVVQLLGTRIEDFSLKADCGSGRWEYMNSVATFMRNVMVKQRNGTPATFEYTTRGWKFNAYIISVPFADAVEEVLRQFEIQMRVQEDVSGLMSKNTLDAELRRLQDGIGFRRSKYNDPRYDDTGGPADPEAFSYNMATVIERASGVAATVAQDFLNTADRVNPTTGADRLLGSLPTTLPGVTPNG